MKVDDIKSAGTVIVTVLIFIFVGLWSFALWRNLGKPPQYLADGKTVRLDEYARAKDIFILVLPLLTTAVGYWFGSQGTVKAQQRADAADAARTQAQSAQLDAENKRAAAEAVLTHIQNVHPEAFGKLAP